MFKKLLFLILFARFGFADTGFPNTIQATENDGSPSCQAGQFKFSNGSLTCSGGVAKISNALASGSTNYIQNTSTLQSGATFYVSSGTVNGSLRTGSLTIPSSVTGDLWFSDSNGQLAQSNNLFWDNSTKYMGVGGFPDAAFTVGGSYQNDILGIHFAPTLYTNIGAQYIIDAQAGIVPQADLAIVYGLLFLPSMYSSTSPVTTINAEYLRVDTDVSYTGTIQEIDLLSLGGAIKNGGTINTTFGINIGDWKVSPFNVGIVSFMSSPSNSWFIYDPGDAPAYIQGSVGIGAGPSYKLDVHATGDGTPIINIADDSGNPLTSQGKIAFTTGGSQIANISGEYNNGNFKLALGANGVNSEAVSILNSGRVGIGVTNPSTLLHMSSGTLTIDGNSGGISVSAPSGVNVTYNVTAGTATFNAWNASNSSTTVTGAGGEKVVYNITAATMTLNAMDVANTSATVSGIGGFKTTYGITTATLTIVNPVIGSTYLLTASTLAAGPFFVDVSTTGHLNFPTVTGSTVTTCGANASLVGSDIAGTITTGSGSPTACTLTFAKPYTNIPVCLCNTNAAVACDPTSTSVTAVTFTLGVTETTIKYICVGRD